MLFANATTHERYARWSRLIHLLFFWRPGSFSARYSLGKLPDDVARDLPEVVRTDAVAITFFVGDAADNYCAGQLDDTIASTVRENFSFFEPRSPYRDPLVRALRHIGQFAQNALGYPVRIVNLRFWDTLPNSAADAGANDWHMDGFPEGVLKVMVYLTAASLENGTTEVRLPDGQTLPVEGPPGTILLFDNNLMHRGVPPLQKGAVRTVMEVTIIPALMSRFDPVFAGLNGQFPSDPWSVRSRAQPDYDPVGRARRAS
jgi:hypothetical protein